MTEYYTTVTASDEFWQRLVSDRLVSGFPTTFISEEAGFTITSKYGPAIWDMIELSNEFPDERFNVVVTTDNIYENVIEYYEFLGGATYFNHLEPLYYFSPSDEVERLVDPAITEKFKKEISQSLDRNIDFVPSYENVIGLKSPKKEMVTNMQFKYGHQDVILTARAIGQTYIEIELESISNDEEQ